MKIQNKKGFTLIELLVVVIIIGILTSVAMPQYSRALEKARLTEALVTVNSLRKAINVYTSENGFQQNAYFLGTDKNTALDVDLDENMDCSANSYCVGKYFRYSAVCQSANCTITVTRLNSSRGTYSLQAIKSKATRKWTDKCMAVNNGPMGPYICGKVLAKQGWQQ